MINNRVLVFAFLCFGLVARADDVEVTVSVVYQSSPCPLFLSQSVDGEFHQKVLSKISSLARQATTGYSREIKQAAIQLSRLVQDEPIGASYEGFVNRALAVVSERVEVSDNLAELFADKFSIEVGEFQTAEQERRQADLNRIRGHERFIAETVSKIVRDELKRLLESRILIKVRENGLAPIAILDTDWLSSVVLPIHLSENQNILDFTRSDLVQASVFEEHGQLLKTKIEQTIGDILSNRLENRFVVSVKFGEVSSILLSGNKDRLQVLVPAFKLVIRIQAYCEGDGDNGGGGGGDEEPQEGPGNGGGLVKCMASTT